MATMASNRKAEIIPCGINLDTFYPLDENENSLCQKIQSGKVNILFCSDFERPVMNSVLAFEAIRLLNEKYEINFIELKSMNRSEPTIEPG